MFLLTARFSVRGGMTYSYRSWVYINLNVIMWVDLKCPENIIIVYGFDTSTLWGLKTNMNPSEPQHTNKTRSDKPPVRVLKILPLPVSWDMQTCYVPGLNPAGDLCWMSFPVCISAVQWSTRIQKKCRRHSLDSSRPAGDPRLEQLCFQLYSIQSFLDHWLYAFQWWTRVVWGIDRR